MWNNGFALKHSSPHCHPAAGISTCCLQSAHIWPFSFLLFNRHLCVSHYHTFPPSGCAAASRQLTCGVTLRRLPRPQQMSACSGHQLAVKPDRHLPAALGRCSSSSFHLPLTLSFGPSALLRPALTAGTTAGLDVLRVQAQCVINRWLEVFFAFFGLTAQAEQRRSWCVGLSLFTANYPQFRQFEPVLHLSKVDAANSKSKILFQQLFYSSIPYPSIHFPSLLLPELRVTGLAGAPSSLVVR